MAEYCADSEFGSNSNTGAFNRATNDWSQAKQSLAAVWALAVNPGDVIVVRTGSLFAPMAGEGRVMVSYINRSSLTIEALPRFASDLTETFPWEFRKGVGHDGSVWDISWWRGAAFSCMVWDAPNAGGWAHVGDGGAAGPIGTWRKAFGASAPGASSGEHFPRVFRDSTLSGSKTRLTHMRVGEGLPNTTVKTALSALFPWYTAVNGNGTVANDDFLYMFTGSASVPPDQFFGGLAIQQNVTDTAQTSGGAPRSFVVRNATNVTVRNLMSIGATSGGFGATNPNAAPAVADLLFDRCVSLCCGYRAFRNDFSVTYPGTRINYLNCATVSNLGPRELLPDNLLDHRGAWEAFECSDYASTVRIVNPTVVDSFHGAFSISAGSVAAAPNDCGVLGAKVYWSAGAFDGHAFSLNGQTNCFVLGGSFYGCPTVAHVAGTGALVRGNYFRQSIYNYREPGETKFIIDTQVGGSLIFPSGCVIEENTFDTTRMGSDYGIAPIAISSTTDPWPIGANAYTVRNNLMLVGAGHAAVCRYITGGGYVSPVQAVYGNRAVSPDGTLGEFVSVHNGTSTPPIARRHIPFAAAYGLYNHTQGSAASTWNINHGLNSVDVEVDVLVGGLYKNLATVVVVDANNVTVSNLGGSVTGTAVVVKGAFSGASDNARLSVAAAIIGTDGVPLLTSPFCNAVANVGPARLGRNGRQRRAGYFTPGCQDPTPTRTIRQFFFDFRSTYLNFGRADITRAGAVGPNTVAQSMANVGAYGFNVCHQAFMSGFGCDFPSTVLRRRSGGATDYIAQATGAESTSGVAIHPWIKTFVGSGQDTVGDAVNSLAQYRAAGWLLQVLNAPGTSVGDIGEVQPGDVVNQKWLSPAIPAVRAFLISAIVEMVQMNPGIKGIVLDFCRYPSWVNMGCYSAASRAWFESWSGSVVSNWPTDCNNTGSRYASWKLFHTYVITSFVAEVAAAVRAVAPNVLIGCSPFPVKKDRNDRLQKPDEWAKAGSINYFSPQCYTQNGDALNVLVSEAEAEVSGTNCKLYPITYTFLDTTNARPQDVVSAERAYIKYRGLRGISEFSWVTEYATNLPVTIA